MDDQAESAGPLFRANKRRKVFRKRDEEATEDDATNDRSGTDTSNAGIANAPASPESALHIQRKSATRKHGIAFNSASKPQAQEVEHGEGMALMPVHPSREQNVVSTDRFVKPTGKAAVVDDRHMLAFVDTKLAEMRSASSTPLVPLNTVTTNDRSQHPLADQSRPDAGDLGPQGPGAGDTALTAAPSRANKRQNVRPRRPPPARDANGVERDSLIDQIMKEGAVPLYDQSTSAAPYRAASGGDNDAAVMEAFKAEFLAEMEEHKKRKLPKPPAGTKGVVPTSNGPKLGGSRSQREKMKALEANKAGVKK